MSFVYELQSFCPIYLTYYIGATQLNSTSAFFVLSDKIIPGSIDAHANMTRCLWKSSIKSVYARERERGVIFNCKSHRQMSLGLTSIGSQLFNI
jgi:hypothetical protein